MHAVLLPLRLDADLAAPWLGAQVPAAHGLGQRGRELARGDRHGAARLVRVRVGVRLRFAFGFGLELGLAFGLGAA